jgi:hypothetical protein
MRAMYQPIASIDRARAALDQCTQGTRSVQAYTDVFRRLVQFLPHMDEGDQKHRYTSNLSAALRTEVLRSKPTTLEDAIHAAVSAEAYLGGPSNRGNAKPGNYYNARWHGGQSSSSSGSGAVSMELGNVNYGSDEDLFGSVANHAYAASGPPSSDTGGKNTRDQKLLDSVQELLSKLKVQDSINAVFQPRGNSNGGERRSGAHVPDVSREDYERCRRENRCLKCRQPGHIAKECTNQRSLKW